MTRIYSSSTPQRVKSLLAGLFLLGSLAAQAQCQANFTYTLGINGMVSFMNTSTGTTSNTGYQWNFYPGSSMASSPLHQYTTNGYKLVCLTITADTSLPGSCTSTKCDSILITNVTNTTTPVNPCSAGFNYTQGSNGAVNFVSTFTNASASTNYFWSFGGVGASASHTYATNGIKWVCLTVTDTSLNCTSTTCDSVFVTSAADTTTLCNPSVMYTLSKDSVMALTWNAYPSYPSNVTNATWHWGDGTFTNGLYPSHTYSAAGLYSTCVTISVSCGTVTASYCYVASIFRSSENQEMITLNVRESLATGIKGHAKTWLPWQVYPNPNQGEFVMELGMDGTELKESTLLIYNMLGEKVLEKQLQAGGKHTIDAGRLSEGMYLLKVHSESGAFHKRISIRK
jgi:PKD repeat protein